MTTMRKSWLAVLVPLLIAPSVLAAGQATVHVEPPDLHGPRPLQERTSNAAIRDYLESWKGMRAALDGNRAGLLDPYFIGTARDKLATAIQGQAAAGIHTRYQDTQHDLQIVFYSPEGLSIQLIDDVVYNQQIFDHTKEIGSHHMHARYVVVLTPAETRWKVRIFQVIPE